MDDTSPDVPELVLYALAPVPPAAKPLDAEVRALRERGLFEELREKDGELLALLGEAWGRNDPRLAPYHYNHALSLKLCGRREESLDAAREGLERWPRSLQHRVLLATLLLDASLEEERILPEAEECVEWLLAPRNRKKLSALRVAPADLALQWAACLYAAGRFAEALEAARRARDFGARGARPAEIEGRALASLKRYSEALPHLEEAARAHPVLENRVLLGTALLEARGAGAAWPVFEAAIEELEGVRQTGRAPRELERELRMQAARALLDLERAADATRVLLRLVSTDPWDPDILRLLSRALRGGGRVEAARALLRRAAELEPAHYELVSSSKARRAGNTAAASYHECRAWLLKEHPGEALSVLDRALEERPDLLALHFLRFEILLGLGWIREAAGAALSAVRETGGSPAAQVLVARALLRSGRTAEASRMLEELESRTTRSPREAALLRALLLRARMELGEWKAVRAALEDSRAGAAARTAAEEVETRLLAEAALALRTGAAGDARLRTQGGGEALPGSASLRRALEAAAALVEKARDGGLEAYVRNLDWSDFADHPWVLRELAAGPLRGASPAELEGLRGDLKRRNELLARIASAGAGERLDLELALLDLYVKGGAKRKARELAWYLWTRDPGRKETALALLGVLSRPEDIAERLHVSAVSLERLRGDPELQSLRRRVLQELGAPP